MRIPAGTLALLLATLPCVAQQSSQNSSSNADQSQASSQSQTQDQNSSSDKSQPAAPAQRKRLPLGQQPAAADANPFPEDISKKAATDAGNSTPEAPAAKADKSSSSGSKPAAPAPDYSSSRTGLKDLDSNDPEDRISDGAGGYIVNPKLAAQDVKVGGFYLVNGDYKGAYARYKEATKVDPENPDAVFGLAEAARGLKLDSEAVDNYRIYLDAFPDGPKARAARKALAALGAQSKK
jgi:tetratricopeptide (TPR) repeat protein